MGKRLAWSALAGGFILFFWGWVWFGMLPMARMVTSILPPAAAEPVVAALKAAALPTGTYHWPAGDDSSEQAFAQSQAAFAAGPVLMLHYRAEGAGFMDPKVMGTGLIHFILSAGLVGWLVARGGTGSYGARWVSVAGIGLAVGFIARFSEPIWFFAPWPHFLYYAAGDVTGWALAGLAMARLLKPAES